MNKIKICLTRSLIGRNKEQKRYSICFGIKKNWGSSGT